MAELSITINAAAVQDVDTYMFTITNTNCSVSAADTEGNPVDLTDGVLSTASPFYITAYPTSGYHFDSAPTITGSNWQDDEGVPIVNSFTAYGAAGAYRYAFNPANPSSGTID